MEVWRLPFCFDIVRRYAKQRAGQTTLNGDFMKLIKFDMYPTIKTQLNYIETSTETEQGFIREIRKQKSPTK